MIRREMPAESRHARTSKGDNGPRTASAVVATCFATRLRPCAMAIQPIEELVDAAGRHRHTRVRGPVVQVDGIAIWPYRVAARKCDVADVALTFVRRLGPEDP